MTKRKTTKAILAGSFDPFTLGHGALLAEGTQIFDEMHVVIANQKAKKYLFEASERQALVTAVVATMGLNAAAVHVHCLEGRFLAHFARDIQATHRLCGLRDLVDFGYEEKSTGFNHEIYPELRTVYMPLPGMANISSSIVKESFGLEGWEDVVARFVHPLVLDALRRRHLGTLQQAA